MIEETSYARVDLEHFLGELEAVRMAKKRVEISSEELQQVHTLSHQIIDEVKSHYITENGKLLDKTKLEPAIGMLLWEPETAEILRCKGKFFANNPEGKPAEFLLQGVGEVFEFR